MLVGKLTGLGILVAAPAITWWLHAQCVEQAVTLISIPLGPAWCGPPAASPALSQSQASKPYNVQL